MTLPEELEARGLVEQTSQSLATIFGRPRTVYLGIDPTADSLHVGHLVPILLMKRLGLAGHTLIMLVGGGTGMIGDPKDKGERVLLDEKTVAANARALERQIKQIFGRVPFRVVDNADWLGSLKLVPFLRDIGKHFTVNDLVKRDLIKKRLETPDESISYTEFTYALLQGFDYYTLHERYGCEIQVGASDQWTNILSGVELIRKKAGKEAYALTVPLVTDANGKKFGKSEGNAIWLDPKKTTPFQFYQFWMTLPDEGIDRYLKVYTVLPLSEIDAAMELHQRSPHERRAQALLARLVTGIVHGDAAAAGAAAASEALFGDTPLHQLSREALSIALAEAPSVTLTARELAGGVPLAEVLVAGALATSKSDARRLIEAKAVMLSGDVLDDPDRRLTASDLPHRYALVRKGKQGVLILVLK